MRVVPDISGVDREFDYSVPPEMESSIGPGTIIRVVLQGRRVRAWVVDDDVEPPEGIRLLPVSKVTGAGPSSEIIDQAAWASDRWLGRRAFHLQTASPPKAVRIKPTDIFSRSYCASNAAQVRVIRIPPAQSPLELVLEQVSRGPVLLITPSQQSAETWHRRLGRQADVALYPRDWQRAATGSCSVVGTRSAVWATMGELTSIIVVDCHDESLKSESSPTWSAVDLAIERADRRGIDCLLLSSTPRAAHRHGREVEVPSRDGERAGWAPLHVVDLREVDPRAGLFSHQLVDLLRSDKRVVCVLNRKGRARMLVCNHCDEMAKCESCTSAVALEDDGLRCPRCRASRPTICIACGSTKFKQLRTGVSKFRDELETLARRSVGEVTGDESGMPDAPILIGTEAVLHRAGNADAVVFVDFDQELMAERISAGEDALILLARASRLVRGRKGIVMVQTRQPDHEVIDAALHGDPSRFEVVDIERRRQFAWPPFVCAALVSGSNGEAFVGRLRELEATGARLDVTGPLDGKWLVTAGEWNVLCARLREARPGKGVRVDVDPIRL